MSKSISEVFGISNEVLPDSYVDRGALDEALQALTQAGKLHVALRGASKCGKSWLRRKILKDPIVVQCRLNKKNIDLYTDALSELGISFQSEVKSSHEIKGTLKAQGEAGFKLLAKAGLEVSTEYKHEKEATNIPAGHDINDLRYVANIIRESGRKLVIEDFHYLSIAERTAFSFDLKAFWDWGVQVIIVGVWSVNNMLLSLNPDLTGRLEEITITWNEDDLGRILDNGGAALNVHFSGPLRKLLIDAAHGNAGQIQTLVVRTLSTLGIKEALSAPTDYSDFAVGENAAMEYAEQLDSRYQAFAQRVASGIRKRTRSTNIYAHTMAVIMDASDNDLIAGLPVNRIFEETSRREPRILLGNLKSVLMKIEHLQIDKDGRGLVLAYSPSRGISVVDRQLLLYRRYATLFWPWEDIIATGAADSFEADDES